MEQKLTKKDYLDILAFYKIKDEKSLLDIIEKIINKNFDKENLILNGMKRSNQFNWNKTCLDIEKIYEKVLA